jgi:hypothetical protein
MINTMQASKVQVGDTIVLYGTQYPVLHAGTVNGTTMLTIRDTPFVSSNYASFKWNDRVEVAFPTCERCKVDNAVPHTNCLYYGTWHSGHSSSHCTANACY